MLKWMGTISAMAAAAVLYEKMKIDRRSELETVASIELRKVLRYAAPPTFLARVSSIHESETPLHWLSKAAGN